MVLISLVIVVGGELYSRRRSQAPARAPVRGTRSRLWRPRYHAAAGSIIAAIITIQMPRNHASPPSAVQGPSSMPRISCAVHAQPTAATAKRAATKPSRARVAAQRVGPVADPIVGQAAQENSDL